MLLLLEHKITILVPDNTKYKGNNSREGVLPACICTVNGSGDNARDEPDGALVGSRQGKRSGGINEEEVY